MPYKKKLERVLYVNDEDNVYEIREGRLINEFRDYDDCLMARIKDKNGECFEIDTYFVRKYEENEDIDIFLDIIKKASKSVSKWFFDLEVC